MSDVEEDNKRDIGRIRPDSSTDLVEEEIIRVGNLSDRQVARARELMLRQRISFLSAAIATRAISRQSLMLALSKQFSYPIIHSESDSARFSRELVVGHEPFGAAAEALRSIRTSLVSSAVAKGVRSFAIVAPRPGMGSTFFAANLALGFAQMSVATLLVDANLRDPRMAEIFGVDRNHDGLSETLRRGEIDAPAIAYDVLPGLSLMASGAVPPNPQELLCSEGFLSLTANFSRDFGVVIYDTPAAMDFADAYVVASRVGAAVIVARKNRAKFNDVSTIAEKLRSVQCDVVGSVLNNA